MAQHKNYFAELANQQKLTPEQIAAQIPELETDVNRIAAHEAAKPKHAPEPRHSTGMDTARIAAATGLRIGGQWGGTTLGGLAGGLIGGGVTAPVGGEGAIPGVVAGASIGGGLGGALGEYLAQKVEPHEENQDPKVNLGRVAVAGGTGAIPMGWLIKAGKPALTALRGAAVGYGGVAGNKLADGKSAEESLNPLEWSRAEQVMGPGLGAGVGALFSHYHAPAKDVTAGPVIDKATEEARLLEGVEKLKKEPVRPGVTDLPHYKGLRVGPKEGGEFPPDIVTGKDTPEMTAMREALEKHTLENPTGDVAKAIYGPGGRPNVKDGKNVIPSVTEMETMHGAGLDYAKAQDKAHFGAIEKTKRELTAEFNKHLNGKNTAMDKAQREIEKTGVQEDRNFKARTKYVTNGLIQDTRNENAVNKFERNMGSAVEGAAKENAKRTADTVADANAQHQQSVIDERIAERPVVNTDAPVREHFNGIGPDRGEARTHTTYSKPEPKKPGEGDVSGGDGGDTGPHVPPDGLSFWHDSDIRGYARDHKMSPNDWKIVGDKDSGYRFASRTGSANSVDTNIIPDEPGQLIGRAAGDGVAVPDEITEDMRKMHGKLFSKKSDAEAFRDAYPGSQIYQYGAKGKYRLEFPAITEEGKRLGDKILADKIEALKNKEESPVDLPRSGGSELGGAEGSVAPYDPNAVVDKLRGGLSREEFQRLNSISTGRFSDASKLTPELQAERAALEAKQRMPQVEVSDYTGGQPEHTIEAAIPGGAEPPVGDGGYPSDWDNIDPEPPTPVPAPKGPKGPKPTPAQKFQARAEALADKQPPVDIAPPVEDTVPPPVEAPKPTPKGTGKSAKLAETNNGLDVLQSLADDVHGGELPQDLNPVSNGQLPAEPYVNPVGEAEQVLPGIEPTVNPDAAPVAEAPFTLVGKPGPKFNPQQSSMLEEPMDGQSVINRAVKREQAKPENVAKVAKLRAQAQSMFDESMARVNPEPTGITVDPGTPQPLPEKLGSPEPPPNEGLDFGGPEPSPVPVEPKPKAGPGGASAEPELVSEELSKPQANTEELGDSAQYGRAKPHIKVVTDIDGTNHVWINGQKQHQFGPGGPTDAEIRSFRNAINDPESFKRLQELKGQRIVGLSKASLREPNTELPPSNEGPFLPDPVRSSNERGGAVVLAQSKPVVPEIDEWGHRVGAPLGSDSLPGDFQKVENVPTVGPEAQKNQEALNLGRVELARLKESYGPLSEEYKEAAQELEDLARSANAKSVGSGNTFGNKAQLSQGGAFPARLFKSKLEAAGENYGAIKDAKKAGEAVPEEGRRIAAQGAQQETNNFADELASGARPVDDIESLPEQSRKIMWDRLKQSLAKANPKNERGALETQLMLRMGLGGAGAAAGAVANDDDPLTGAVMGGAAGAALPSLGKGLGKIDWSALGKRLPDIQRAFYLSEPNGLAANTIGAPMGLGATTAIEKMLEGKFSGNPALVKQGTNLFKGLRTIPSRMRNSVNEAGNMLASSPDNISESLPFQTENNKVFKYMKLPATYITAAHLALRDVARDAGVPLKEAVNIALGNEPGEALAAENWMSSHIRALGQGMQNLKSTRVENPGSPEKTKNIIANIIAPFTRTASNVAASTPMKVPGLGLLLKAGGAPESWASVGSQQVLGSGIAAGSYALGANVDPDTAKIVRKWVRNISGKYGLVATTAFEAGQASQTGKKTAGNVLFNGISEGVPMPTMEVPKDWWNFGQSVIDGNPQVPQSAIPGVIRTLMDTAEVGTPKNKSHKKAF